MAKVDSKDQVFGSESARITVQEIHGALMTFADGSSVFLGKDGGGVIHATAGKMGTRAGAFMERFRSGRMSEEEAQASQAALVLTISDD